MIIYVKPYTGMLWDLRYKVVNFAEPLICIINQQLNFPYNSNNENQITQPIFHFCWNDPAG